MQTVFLVVFDSDTYENRFGFLYQHFFDQTVTVPEKRWRMTEMHAVVTRAECCEGWDDTDPGPGLRCEPRCHAGCDGGWCHAPGQCLCHAGYSGPRCNIRIETTTLSTDTTTSSSTTTTTSTTSTTTTTTTVTSSEASTETKVDGIESYQEFDVVNVTTEITMTADKFAMRTTETGEMGSILGGNLLIVILSVFAVLFTASIILTAVYFR